MNAATPLKRTYGAGREDQYREMMKELARLEGKYTGVRGVLLARVREELAKTEPTAGSLSVVSSPEGAAESHPSCRVCGREMKLNGTDGRLVCQNGHSR